MNIAERGVNFVVAFLKSYGPTPVKKLLWDREFSGTKWNVIDNMVGDCVYADLEKYGKGGDILDLGCGPGNTANELAPEAYRRYLGVDISDVALQKARKRTIAEGRIDKNEFVQSDFLHYEPKEKFDVILFRESIYHVPMTEIERTLNRYAKHLKEDGVFVIPIAVSDAAHEGTPKPRPSAMVRILETELEVVEKNEYEAVSRPMVLILRPRNRN